MVDGNAPEGGWTDTPTAPPAPEGHATQTPQAPPAGPSKGFDAAAYLATLPADEQAAKASLPPEILEKDSKRQMRRSDYDRKRGAEAETLRTLQAQNQLLATQNQQMLTMLEGGGRPNGEAQPSLDEIGQKLYEADNPSDYAAGVAAIVQQTVGAAVSQAIESNPVIRKLQAGVALRQGRSSVDGATAADHSEAEKSLARALAAKGVTLDQLDKEAIEVFYPAHLEAATARRQLVEARAAGSTTKPPVPPPARPTLPVPGSGISGGGHSTGKKAPFGPDSTLQERQQATLLGLNMTQQQLDEIAARS